MGKLGAVVLGVLVACRATASPDQNVDAVRKCMASNLVQKGAVRELELVSTDREGNASRIALNMYWKPDEAGHNRTTLQIREPEDLAGAAYLLKETPTENELYVYLPDSGAVKKITGAGAAHPILGTAISFSEIKYAQGMFAGDSITRQPDAIHNGRPVHVIESELDPKFAEFRRVVISVDKQSCTVLGGAFYGDGATPEKLLEADTSLLFETETHGRKVWLLLGYTMRDLKQGTRTAISLGEIHLLENISSGAFASETFYKHLPAEP